MLGGGGGSQIMLFSTKTIVLNTIYLKELCRSNQKELGKLNLNPLIKLVQLCLLTN